MLDTNLANAQAEGLRSQINNLNTAKSQLSAYKSNINNYWQNKKVTYISNAI